MGSGKPAIGPYIRSHGEGVGGKGPGTLIKYIGTREEQEDWCRRLSALYAYHAEGGSLGEVLEEALAIVRRARASRSPEKPE